MPNLKIRVHENKVSNFAPEFYVSTIDGEELPGQAYATYGQAVSAARKLSLANRGTPYTVIMAMGTPVLYNGKLMNHSEYEDKYASE